MNNCPFLEICSDEKRRRTFLQGLFRETCHLSVQSVSQPTDVLMSFDPSLMSCLPGMMLRARVEASTKMPPLLSAGTDRSD